MKILKQPYDFTAFILILATFFVTPSFAKESAPSPHGAIAHTVTVEDTMNSGGYTYAHVKKGEQTFWVAAPQTDLKKGETISFYEQMMMEQFTSKTLKRTFERILFVSAISKGDTLPTTAAPVPNSQTPSMDIPAIRTLGKVEGRFSVAELYTKATELAGKTIEAKGKIVKISRNIMGRNWIHIQDGTGEAQTSKIVFRTIEKGLVVGDEVVAKGILELNKQFGMNYFYPVIVEDAIFTK